MSIPPILLGEIQTFTGTMFGASGFLYGMYRDSVARRKERDTERLAREKELAEQAKRDVERTREQDSANLGNILQERKQIADDNRGLREELKEFNNQLRSENDRLHLVNEDMRQQNADLLTKYKDLESKFDQLQTAHDQLKLVVDRLKFVDAQVNPPTVVNR